MPGKQFGPYYVELTHPDKVLFPEAGITKTRLVDYYCDVADFMVPYLRDRPLMMHRFPDGIGEPGFYQKAIGSYFPEWIQRIEVAQADGSTTYVVCNNRATLAYLANQASIAQHVWLSRQDRLDSPDRLVFDLDPPDVAGDFDVVRRASRRLKQLLDQLELPSYVGLTGSSGLHVVVPLQRVVGFDGVRGFARAVAEWMADRFPHEITVEQRKVKRQGRLLIDTARNAYAQTVVAPYAVRALPGAPVATPLDWDELDDEGLTAQSYTISNILRRLEQRQDPWLGMSRHAVTLPPAINRLHELRDELA